MRFKYYILGGLIIVIGVVIWAIFFRETNMSMKKFAAYSSGDTATARTAGGGVSSEVVPARREPSFCPKKEDLIKEDTKWLTADRRWETYTPSSAARILNFIGVQWIGIKVGQVICLYEADEAVSFPLALEQTRSQLILEPKSAGWGPLTGKDNVKFCASANIADCPFFVEQVKDVSNVYEEIKYAPKAPN